MHYQLHIDLLKCEFCSQHCKLLVFCSACGRARTKVIIAQPHEYRLDRPSLFRCTKCSTRHNRIQYCLYCDPKPPKKKSQWSVLRAPELDTQEAQDAIWNKLRKARTKVHGKKRGSYEYGKGLSTNFAAPMIVKLRREAAQSDGLR